MIEERCFLNSCITLQHLVCISEAGRPCDEQDPRQQRRGQWGWRRRKVSPRCRDTGAASSSDWWSHHCCPGESGKKKKSFILCKADVFTKVLLFDLPQGEHLISHMSSCLPGVCLLLGSAVLQTLHSLHIWKASPEQSCSSWRHWVSYQDMSKVERKKSEKFHFNWMDVVQHFCITHVRLLFEGLRITLVFCLNPGKLGWDIVNVFGAITCLIFEKCIFNFIRLFVFFISI